MNGGQSEYGETTVKVSCPAGGYVVAKGTIDQFSYEVFAADHNHIEVPIKQFYIKLDELFISITCL